MTTIRKVFALTITLFFLSGCGEEAIQEVSQSDEQFRKGNYSAPPIENRLC